VAEVSRLGRQPLAGRADELGAIVGVVRAAVGGRAGALLVWAQAGVGKTALLREGCSQVTDVADVVWGTCLPLASLTVPFLPLVSALRDRTAGRDVPTPVLRLSDGGPTGDEPVRFDAWLDEVCRQRPVVLVVDDLHWADQSSLDVLMYVLAGQADRRLAVLGAVRSGEVGEGHPLHRWLADVRRLPGVGELHLGPLDRIATAQQVTGLLGRPPHETLVDEVFAHTHGNPYLTTLLVRDLQPDASTLPVNLPADLREAATRAWHGLPLPARELIRLVAVAGGPQHADGLAEVAGATGMSSDVVPALRQAVDGGVLETGADGTHWFVHPLLAEVLEAGLLPEERRRLHAAFAASLEPPPGTGTGVDLERAVGLADHHHRAGHREQAYRWALLGAEAAGQVGGATETLRLLRRALDLWPGVPDAGVSRLGLLRRIRAAAEQAGNHEQELTAVDDLLALVDRQQQPLLAAGLLVRRMQLRHSTGREFASLTDVREAVRLSAPQPGSAEHALAVAELAHAELWHAEPSGPARAAQAVRLARACGSAKALAYALTANVMARVLAEDGGGLAEAEEAQAAAMEARDFWAFVHAALWAANSLDGPASREWIEHCRHSREVMTSLGAPHTYIARLSADEAQGLLLLGDWRGCVDRLRVALGSSPGPMGDTSARLTAALLAGWQGRSTEAAAHIARAEEIFDEQSSYLAFPFDAVRAELATATGDTERAVAAALSGANREPPPTLSERLIPLAARALADEVQALRDRGADPAPALARMHDVQRRYPTVVAETGPGSIYQAQVNAMQELYDAEVQRAEAAPAAAGAWARAAKACLAAELSWDEAYAQWRAAEALLKERSARDAGAVALRRAHELAVDLEAAPLRAEVEALARSARVSLAVVPGRRSGTAAPVLPGLPREREVLALVVAGRTYGEIARELVVSEKTVSVHISNLLRKSGTTGRVELAQLVRRLAASG